MVSVSDNPFRGEDSRNSRVLSFYFAKNYLSLYEREVTIMIILVLIMSVAVIAYCDYQQFKEERNND